MQLYGNHSPICRTTTTHDPIADHVNLLLQQYFSTQTPDADTSDQGVPMITYDDENNSIVMEYLSPDGSTSSFTKPHNDEHSEPEQEAGKAIPNFFPQPDNADTALLPILTSSSKSNMEVLDRVFEPSQTPGMYFLKISVDIMLFCSKSVVLNQNKGI